MGCCLSRAERAANTAGALQRVVSGTQRAPEPPTVPAPPLPSIERRPSKAPSIGGSVPTPSVSSSQGSSMSRAQSQSSEMPPIAEDSQITEEQMLAAIMRTSRRRFKSGLDKDAYAEYLRKGEAGKTPTVGPAPGPESFKHLPGPHLPTIADET